MHLSEYSRELEDGGREYFLLPKIFKAVYLGHWLTDGVGFGPLGPMGIGLFFSPLPENFGLLFENVVRRRRRPYPAAGAAAGDRGRRRGGRMASMIIRRGRSTMPSSLKFFRLYVVLS